MRREKKDNGVGGDEPRWRTPRTAPEVLKGSTTESSKSMEKGKGPPSRWGDLLYRAERHYRKWKNKTAGRKRGGVYPHSYLGEKSGSGELGKTAN